MSLLQYLAVCFATWGALSILTGGLWAFCADRLKRQHQPEADLLADQPTEILAGSALDDRFRTTLGREWWA